MTARLTLRGPSAPGARLRVHRGRGLRVELAGQGTLVSALVPGLVGTQTLFDFADNNGIALPDNAVIAPADLVRLALDGLEAGDIEIMDALSADAKATLSGPPRAFAL